MGAAGESVDGIRRFEGRNKREEVIQVAISICLEAERTAVLPSFESRLLFPPGGSRRHRSVSSALPVYPHLRIAVRSEMWDEEGYSLWGCTHSGWVFDLCLRSAVFVGLGSSSLLILLLSCIPFFEVRIFALRLFVRLSFPSSFLCQMRA